MNRLFIKQLHEINSSQEGSLFNNDSSEILLQTNFIQNIIAMIQPENVVEIGTNKGFFSYFVSQYNVIKHIDTFDIEIFSDEAVAMINKENRNSKIKFYHGNSKQTFTNFVPEYQIQLAYIDGCHDYDICLCDLINCDRLEIKNILVDDYNIKSVKKAGDNFCRKFNYTDTLQCGDLRKLTFLKFN